jgi:cytochrome P450
MSPEPQNTHHTGERSYPFGTYDKLNVHPLYRYLQENEAFARVRMPYGDSAILVTRHDDVKTVFSDAHVCRTVPVGCDPARATFDVIPMGLIGMDPPEHTRIRRLISGAFTPQRAERQRPATEQCAKVLLDDIVVAGPPADLVQAYAVPLAMGTICDLLGVPFEDRDEFHQWILVMNEMHTGADEVRMEYIGKLATYIAELIEQRRSRPAEDLISELIQAQEDDRLAVDELIFLCMLLLVAGFETTSNQISNSVYLLLTHPDQLTLLRNHPELLPGAVEELLRYTPLSAYSAFPFFATADVKFGERTVAAGQQLLVSTNAANRDPRVFEDPERLDICRTGGGHLSFGHGPHYCVGAALARMELRVALGMLLDRLPGLRLAVDAGQLPWKPNLLFRGPIELPITW